MYETLRDSVYSDLKTPHRRHKYPLHWLFHVPEGLLPMKAKVLEKSYLLMREVDDYVDGDKPLPAGCISIRYFLEERKRFVLGGEPSHEIDHLLAELISSVPVDLHEPLKQSMVSLLDTWTFDHDRQNVEVPQVLSEEELEQHVLGVELEGVMQGVLVVCEEDVSQLPRLQNLVLACRRYHYFLRDFPEDVADGLFNLSLEELGDGIEDLLIIQSKAQLYKERVAQVVTPAEQKQHYAEFCQALPDRIKSVMVERALHAQQLLKEFDEEQILKDFNLITQAVLYFLYRKRASAFLKNFIDDIQQ